MGNGTGGNERLTTQLFVPHPDQEPCFVNDRPMTLANPPHSIKYEPVRQQRSALHCEPHIAPLTACVDELRQRGLGEVPYFDPLDARVNAKILFLFEKPGPMTSSERGSLRTGSGFISHDNYGATAEATFRFMEEAAIPSDLTVTWNVIPGWNGTIDVTRDELSTGITCVDELVSILPNLKVIVLVGKMAEKAQSGLEQLGLKVLTSAHPSPRVRASFRIKWDEIPIKWTEAMKFV